MEEQVKEEKQMPQQLLLGGGELQESARMGTSPGDDLSRPQARQHFRGVARHLGEERQNEKLVSEINSRNMGFWDKRLSAAFQFYRENYMKSYS